MASSIRCRLGWHRYRPVREWQASPIIFGLECPRCKARRLSVFGSRARPPRPGSAAERTLNEAVQDAQTWAAELSRLAPSSISIWWR